MTEPIKKPKTLLEIKNEVANEWFAKNSPISQEKFRIFDFLHTYTQHELWPEVCRRAQLECARETLKLAETNHRLYPQEFDFMNEENIKLIQ